MIGNIKLNEAIINTDIKNLDLISSTVNLSGLEVETATNEDRAFTLKNIFDSNSNILKNMIIFLLIVLLHLVSLR